LLALERFVSTPDGVRERHLTVIAQALLEALAQVPGVKSRIIPDAEGRGVPRVEVAVPAAPGAHALCDRLRAGSPSVRVDASRAHSGVLLLIPTCLGPGDAVRIAAAFTNALG
jgi:hypothetical protein